MASEADQHCIRVIYTIFLCFIYQVFLNGMQVQDDQIGWVQTLLFPFDLEKGSVNG